MDRLKNSGRLSWVGDLKTTVLVALVIAFLANISGRYAYNIAVSVLLLWAVHKDETSPLLVSLSFLVFSAVVDLCALGIYGGSILSGDAQTTSQSSAEKFCLVVTILGLSFKPWNCLLVWKRTKEVGYAAVGGHG